MGTKKLFSIGIILSFLVSAVPAAPTTETETDARREQMRKEAQVLYVPVGKTLAAILEKVNLNQRPSPEQIQKAVALLESNKRNVALYENPQKAGYLLLQSWVAYFQGDPVGNMNSATRACKENPVSGDAWASQTLFSLVYGRMPIEPKAPRPSQAQNRPPRQPRPRRNGETPPAPAVEAEPIYDPSAPYGQPGTLSFNPAVLQKDFLRQQFAPMEFTTTDNKKIAYTPGTDTLCLLFWRAEEAIESITPATTDAAADPSVVTPATEIKGPGLEDQRAYFEAIMDALIDKKEVKFLEINTNSSVFAEEALKNSKSGPACPLVMASFPESGATPFARLTYQSPFMAIIDKDGKVRYAGPADGFVPAFILTHITGVTLDVQPSQPTPQGDIPAIIAPGGVDPNQIMPPMPPLDSAPMPVNTPETPQTTPAKPKSEKKYRELPLEQQIEAEKKVTYIRDLFIKGSRAKIQSYRRGVEMCREVMRDYPDTEYADQARQLLRQVPENKRATYNITNEELGL